MATRHRGQPEKTERNDAVRALAQSGVYTLDELGAAAGVTRERIRQILNKGGVTTRRGGGAYDLPRLMQTIRHPDTRSVNALVVATGVPAARVKDHLSAFALLPAVTRLFAWRVRRRATGWERYLERARGEKARLGRPLTSREFAAFGPGPTIRNYVVRARIALGEIAVRPLRRQAGHGSVTRGLLRGALLRPSGIDPAEVAAVFRTSRASVIVSAHRLVQRGQLVATYRIVDRHRHVFYRLPSHPVTPDAG